MKLVAIDAVVRAFLILGRRLCVDMVLLGLKNSDVTSAPSFEVK
ncbi:hypothetical protein [Candidatus Anaplasma sp. TIGMIC]|nr:hypothetical protein [Candidatus Anaplasma sp. TIGMIC]